MFMNKIDSSGGQTGQLDGSCRSFCASCLKGLDNGTIKVLNITLGHVQRKGRNSDTPLSLLKYETPLSLVAITVAHGHLVLHERLVPLP